MENPQVRLDQLSDKLRQLQAQRNTLRIQREGIDTRLSGLLRTFRNRTGEAAAIEVVKAELARNIAAMEEVDAQISIVQGQIAQATKAIADYNEALASAAAQGLTGAAAEAKANAMLAEAEGKKTLFIGIGIAVLLIVVVVIWYKLKK